MPKFPQPFYREDRRRWYVQIDGKHVNLGPDEQPAFMKYHAVMAARGNAPLSAPASSAQTAPLVSVVLDAYLGWCEANRSPRTFEGHRWHLQRFLSALPNRQTLTASGLTARHLEDWANRKKDGKHVWGPTYRRNAIASVKCAFAWAVENKLLAASPVALVKKPEAARNRRAVTPGEFRGLIAAAAKGNQKDFLTVLWETGMRPHELRTVEARHADGPGGRLLIPSEEAKGRKYDRVVLLTPEALEVVGRLAAERPEGPLFLNSRGRPWTNFALNCLFRRLCKKAGFHASPYLFRHGFATKLLKANEGPATVAALMGHRDPTMVMKVYQHVGDDAKHLRDALSRASGT